MKISTRSDTYETPATGSCSTRDWERDLEWTSVKKYYQKGGKWKRAIDRLIETHARRLPETMRAGRDVTSALDDESLFPDTIYLMTACGSNGSWDPPRKGKTRIHSLIGFPNSF